MKRITVTTLYFSTIAAVAAAMALHGLVVGVGLPLADLPAFQSVGLVLAGLIAG